MLGWGILKNSIRSTFPVAGLTSLVAQTLKNAPAMPETWVQSLGWEDLPEKGMATHSSILAWRIPMDRGAWWATVHGVAESDRAEQLSTTHSTAQA